MNNISKTNKIPLTRDNFDWEAYVDVYGDLRQANINTRDKAWQHWITNGSKEYRVATKIIEKEVIEVKKIIVRLYGEIFNLTGYGTTARNYIKHLMSLDYIDLYIEYPKNEDDNKQMFEDSDFMEYVRKSPLSINYDIICQSPKEGLYHNCSDHTAWCWFWETSKLPNNINEFLKSNPRHINISTSPYLTNILKENGHINPCYTIKHWHLPNISTTEPSKSDNVNDTVKFYTIAQDVERKNLDMLFDAYLEEFTKDDNVQFVAKISPYRRPISILINSIDEKINERSPKLEILVKKLSTEEIASLHGENDVFVLAQHSEGWGIPHIEALLSGNPLVTVNYGALPDFVNDGNSFEIPYIVDKINKNNSNNKESIFFYPDDSMWAIPKKEDIKAKLRETYNNYKEKKANIVRDFDKLVKYFSFEDSLNQWDNFFKGSHYTVEHIPKISLITSMFRASAYLAQLMEDVTRQTIFKEKCEWIILDANPQDDDTDYNMIKEYIDMYPDNIIYKKLIKDKGIYDTWNKAIIMSSGEFITNMNCDDRRLPDSLEKMGLFLLNNADISLVYCDSYITHEDNINWDEIKKDPTSYERYNMREFSISNLLKFNVPHNNPVWKKSLHDKFGYFDAKYRSAGDADFWLRCAFGGAVFKKYPGEILGIYFRNPVGMSTNADNYTSFIIAEDKDIKNKYVHLL